MEKGLCENFVIENGACSYLYHGIESFSKRGRWLRKQQGYIGSQASPAQFSFETPYYLNCKGKCLKDMFKFL